jgi:hypothetical protein
VQVPAGIDPDLQATIRRDIDESFVAAFRVAMFASAALALSGAASALLLVSSTPRGGTGYTSAAVRASSLRGRNASHDRSPA